MISVAEPDCVSSSVSPISPPRLDIVSSNTIENIEVITSDYALPNN